MQKIPLKEFFKNRSKSNFISFTKWEIISLLRYL